MRKTKDLFVEIDGLKIYYDDAGTSLIPIIFIHGFPFDKSSWKPQMQFFQKTHRVIAFDIRGFGKSNTTIEKDSINIYAEDLIKLMDALHIEKAIVCGLSMGGYVLLNAVYNHPDRFDAIVLCDTKCEADSDEAKTMRLESIEAIKNGGLQAFVDGFAKKVFCQNTLDNSPKLVENITKLMLSTPQNTLISSLLALAERAEACVSLGNINTPTLIICGKEDAVTPTIHAKYLHENIKNSKLHFIENAGHLSNLEQSKQFNSLIERFIANKPTLVPVPLYGNEFVRIPPVFEK